MKFSLRVNNDLKPAQLVDMAVMAERMGFDQMWVSNDLFLRSAPTMAAMMLQATKKIHIGIGIMNPYSVHVSELAMIGSTLQEASHGRFILGLGAGAADFLGWAGIERPKPLTKTREAFEQIKALSRGERPYRFSEGWTSEGYLRYPVEFPIYIGAMSPKMTELIGEIADGGLTLLFPPEHFEEAYAQVKTGAERAGRDINEIDVPAAFWVSVDKDRDKARFALAEKIAYYGAAFSPYLLEKAGLTVSSFDSVQEALIQGDIKEAANRVTDQMLTLGIAGDSREVIRRCQYLKEIGASHLSFGPPLNEDPITGVEILGREILPSLR